MALCALYAFSSTQAQLTNKSLAYLYLKGRVGFKPIQVKALFIQTLAATNRTVAQSFSMQKTLSKAATSITELKKNPSRVLADAAGASVALLDQNHVVAYLVPAELYEQILERLDDFDLAALAKARAAEKSIQVSLEDL